MIRFRRLFAGMILLVMVLAMSLSLDLLHSAPALGAQPGTLLPLPTDPTTGKPLYPGVDISTYTQGQSGSQGVIAAIRGLFATAKGILAPVLVFIIGGFGIQMVVAGGNEEKFNTASRHFLYILIGTAFVVFASFLSDTFSLYQEVYEGSERNTFISNNYLISETARKITEQLDLIIRFLRYVLSGIAVFYVVKSGSALIMNADEETATKQKEVFGYGFVGFLLIMVAESLVRVVFDINPNGGPFGSFFVAAEVNVTGGLGLLTNITNLFLAGLSGLFLFSLVAGGAMYAFSAGNEERGQQATKIIMGSLIGLVIAFSSYTLVSEFAGGGKPAPVNTEAVKPLVPPSSPAPIVPAPNPIPTP